MFSLVVFIKKEKTGGWKMIMNFVGLSILILVFSVLFGASHLLTILSVSAGIEIIILCHLCGKLLITETQMRTWSVE